MRCLKKLLAAVMCIGMVVLSGRVNVLAAEIIEENSTGSSEGNEVNYNPFEGIVDNSGIVWSESEYDGWSLTWSVGDFYDMLDSIEKDGVYYRYTYDDAGRRIAKSSDGITVTYTYDEAGKLVSENDGSNITEYIYSYDDEEGYMLLTGLRYNGIEYSYEFDANGSISGILYQGEKIAGYEYFYGSCIGVYGRNEAGEWEDKRGDTEFIGNINPYRYVRQYLDVETGWYWVGRYYSQP